MGSPTGMAAKQLASAAFRFRLPPLPSTNDLIRLYKLRAIKQLSQNFLLDPKLTSKLVRSSGRVRNCYVCEVGPGPGSITRSILEQGADHITVIEKDPRFLPLLQLLQDACDNKLDVQLGDVLTYNMQELFPKNLVQPWDGPTPKIHLIGNLPFNVATPLIIRWLKDISLRTNAWSYGRVRMTLTFQKEVAERMKAFPGDAQRCRMSIMCQNWCDVDHKFTIPGRAFVPKPDVDVGVVHFIPRVEPQIPLDFWLVEKVVRCVFSFRQKYSKKGAAMLFPLSQRQELVTKMFTVGDVDPTIRPFELTIPEFNRLCHAYAAIVEQMPQLAKFNAREQKMSLHDIDDSDNG